MSPSRQLRSHMCINTDTCSSHGEPHTYMNTHTHREGVSSARLIEGERRRDGDREKERHSGREGIWRRARWREEPQYVMRDWKRGGEERVSLSLLISPTV